MKKVISFILVSCLIFGLVACGGSVTDTVDKLQEQLELGQKYLTEADYENALIAFETAIKIDDKCVEAYIGAADAYIGLGEPEKAMEILNIGLEKTGDESIRVKYDDISSASDFSEEKLDSLSELIDLSELEDIEGIMAFLESGDFKEISDWMHRSGKNRYIFGENPNRIGLYLVDYSVMVYVGEYSGDERNGQGSWMGQEYYATGTWSGDKPNGHQDVRETGAYNNHQIIGNVVDGKWDGTVLEYTSGMEWTVNYNMGKPVIIREYEEDGEINYVVAEIKNDVNDLEYAFSNPEGPYAIKGFNYN